MCGNCEGPDITGLITVYAHPEQIELNDVGYDFICILFRDYLNLDFVYFRYIVTLVFMMMLWNTLNYFKVNIHMFLGLYMIYLFFIDTIQHRNFYAMVVITFSARYLIRNAKFDTLKFTIITLLMSTIHIITLTNFLYLIARKMNPKTSIMLFAGLGVLITILSFLAKLMGGNLMLMISSVFLPNESRVDSYFETETHLSGPALGALVLWAVWLVYKARVRVMKVISDVKTKQITNVVFLYSLVTLILLGTLFLNVSFYRFFRNLLLLQFMVMILCMNSYKNNSVVRFGYFISVLGLSIMWFVIDICLIEGYDVCVDPIFEHNFLWESPII